LSFGAEASRFQLGASGACAGAFLLPAFMQLPVLCGTLLTTEQLILKKAWAHLQRSNVLERGAVRSRNQHQNMFCGLNLVGQYWLLTVQRVSMIELLKQHVGYEPNPKHVAEVFR